MNAKRLSEDFPESRWNELRDAMESRGPVGVVDYIDGFRDAQDQWDLFDFSQRAFSTRPWRGKNLDALVVFAKLGIARALQGAKSATDEEEARVLKDFANVMSYNLSADMAECWPNDPLPREKRHFETGLSCALDCIRWREELNKNSGSRSIAWWAKGMHELSLRQVFDATASFEKSLEYTLQSAREQELPAYVNSAGHWSVLLACGYLGIARTLADDPRGAEEFKVAVTSLEKSARQDVSHKEDCRFCAEQLRLVEKKFLRK